MGLFGGKKKQQTVPGTAQVLAVYKPIERARYVNCKLDLVVQAPGVAPFQGQANKKALRWNRVPQTGMTIAVMLDPSNPADFEVAWDELPDHDEQIANQAQQIIGGTDFESPPAETSTGTSRIEQLERLAALHGTGALTDAEFAAEKQRLG